MNETKVIIRKISEKVKEQNGRTFYVGGRNRDLIMGKEITDISDIDLEIYGVPKNTLIRILSSIGKVDFVGKHFGVFKMKPNIDIALPRKEIVGKILEDKKNNYSFTSV